ASRSDERSSTTAGGTQPLAALVFDGALEVDLALLALAHEPLQLLLELGVAVAAVHATRRRILQGLDRQIDLAVLLDRDDLGLDGVALAEVLADVLDVVAVDLGDVDEAHSTAFELDERSVRGDALHGPLDDRADLQIRYRFLLTANGARQPRASAPATGSGTIPSGPGAVNTMKRGETDA